MIRGYFRPNGVRRRPFVVARVAIPSQRVADDVHLLVDTGADTTLLSPTDALFLRVDLTQLLLGPPTTGVGGSTPTVHAAATLILGPHTHNLMLRVLALVTRAQRGGLARIPSLLGRDVLAHYAPVVDQRTNRVLLLDPPEADALSLP